MWSRAYLEANRQAMARQQVEVGVQDVRFVGRTDERITRCYDLSGRLLQGPAPRGIVLIGGKKVLIK